HIPYSLVSLTGERSCKRRSVDDDLPSLVITRRCPDVATKTQSIQKVKTLALVVIMAMLFQSALASDRLDSGPPKSTECYSCMSLSYEMIFPILSRTFTNPLIFSNRCNDPENHQHMPTVRCSSVCATLFEPDIEG
ncbi:hypothetical protein PENTCL1PPCAC_3316, partial [Pristionchus entomophagus]